MRWAQLALLGVAFALIEALIGGTRLLFSLPSLGLLALAGFMAVFTKPEGQRPAHTECLLVTAVLAGVVVVRAWLSPVGYLARTDVCLLLGAVMVYLLTALVLTRSRHRFGFLGVLLALVLMQVGLGVWQHFKGGRFTLFGLLEPQDYGWRATGSYICPNHLAGFLQVTALFGLGVTCWSRRSVWVRALAAFAAVASLFGLALSGSRGGFISAVVGLVVFGGISVVILLTAGGRRGWMTALVGLTLAVFLTGGAALMLKHQYALRIRASNLLPQDDARYDLWRAAWQQAQLQPLTGTGSGSYQYYARQFRPSRVQSDPVFAHNDYLQLLAEYGAIGLLAGLAFLGCHIWRGLHTVRERLHRHGVGALPQDDRLAFTVAALAAVVASAVHALVDFNLHVPANAMLLAFVFGLLANPGGAPQAAEVGTRASLLGRFALPAAALWIAAIALPTLPAEFQAERTRQALRGEHYADAVAHANVGLARDDKNPFLWLHLGQSHASLAESAKDQSAISGHLVAAAEAFERGLQLYPREQWLLVGLAQALDGLGRFAEADPIYVRAIEANPTSASMRFFHGTHLRLAGRFAEAEAEFRKSLELWYNPAAVHGMELLAQARQPQTAP